MTNTVKHSTPIANGILLNDRVGSEMKWSQSNVDLISTNGQWCRIDFISGGGMFQIVEGHIVGTDHSVSQNGAGLRVKVFVTQ